MNNQAKPTVSASLLARVRGLMRREADRQAAEQPTPARAQPTAVTPITRAEHNDPDIQMLETDARHQRLKLALYQARIYAGKPTRITRLRELERTSAGADARLKRARGPRKRQELR